MHIVHFNIWDTTCYNAAIAPRMDKAYLCSNQKYDNHSYISN